MQNRKDMTTGPILPLLLRFSFPLLMTSILQQTYAMADAVIIRSLAGLNAFSAIGSTGTLLWISESMLIGLTQGFSVVFSQIFGSKNKEGLAPSWHNAMLCSFLLAMIMVAAVLPCSSFFLRLVQTPETLMRDAQSYYLTMLFFIVMASLFNTSAALLRAIGDSTTPFRAMLISSAGNIALDFVLIRYARLGVAGAALATGLSQAAAFLACLWKINRLGISPMPRHGEIKAGYCLPLMKMGLPSMFRDGIIACGGGLVQSCINSFGISVTAGVAASKKYFTLLQMGSYALEGASATFTGQNQGAGNSDRIRKGTKCTILLGIVSSLVIGSLCAIFAEPLIGFVVGIENREALASGAAALRWACAFLPSLYILCIVRAALHAMGHAAKANVSCFTELGMRILSVMALPAVIGVTTVYIAEELGWFVTMIYLLVCYRSHFKQIKKG